MWEFVCAKTTLQRVAMGFCTLHCTAQLLLMANRVPPQRVCLERAPVREINSGLDELKFSLLLISSCGRRFSIVDQPKTFQERERERERFCNGLRSAATLTFVCSFPVVISFTPSSRVAAGE